MMLLSCVSLALALLYATAAVAQYACVPACGVDRRCRLRTCVRAGDWPNRLVARYHGRVIGDNRVEPYPNASLTEAENTERGISDERCVGVARARACATATSAP